MEWLEDLVFLMIIFNLSQAISYQYYKLNNYYTGLFTFGDGESHNLSYNISLLRNNTYTNPIFPTGGSSFTISARLSPPYSLITGDDFSDVEQRKNIQIIKESQFNH